MVTICAELGSNHDGQEDRAHALIALAAACGADAVKFQSFRADRLRSSRRLTDRDWRTLRPLELPDAWLPGLRAAAHDHGMRFIVSVFDVEDVSAVADHADLFKVASLEMTDHLLLRTLRSQWQQTVLSTGLASREEVRAAVEALRPEKLEALLHCVAAYPAPLMDINLRAMRTLEADCVGLSDHSGTTTIPIAAAALGAGWLEVHLTDDHRRVGPDHGAHALEPREFAEMVRGVRQVEQALGDGDKRMRESEAPLAKHRVTTQPEPPTIPYAEPRADGWTRMGAHRD